MDEACAFDLLPPLLQDFVQLIGLQATFALVERLGGLRIYIPTPDRVSSEHAYSAIIGVENLQRLAQQYGGIEHFQLPKASRALKQVRDARIAAEYAHKTARQLAAEYRLTEGHIARILAAQGAAAPPDRRQRKLF